MLQTLALIQQQAGPASEAARLARAQERELRDWLFAGTAPVAPTSPPTAQSPRSIELDYAVRIDVVAAGRPADAGQRARSRAAREADAQRRPARRRRRLGLPRDAPRTIERLRARPRARASTSTRSRDGRLGVRESIIGRMQRAGGAATVRPAGGTGTEVRLLLRPDRRSTPRRQLTEPDLTVVIVDDHSIFRSGLRADLDRRHRGRRRGGDVDEAVALVAATAARRSCCSTCTCPAARAAAAPRSSPVGRAARRTRGSSR